MRVVFRADASVLIGTGHVMRCLTLADALKSNGAEVVFVCRKHEGHLAATIEAKGYQVKLLSAPVSDPLINEDVSKYAQWLGVDYQQDAEDTINVIGEKIDWLIVDHYGLDEKWHQILRSQVCKILVIDDLANRAHDCDLLLDQNLYADMKERYTNLVSNNCKQLIGPQYALLREEFLQASHYQNSKHERLKRLFVFIGGSDSTNETGKVMDAVRSGVLSELHADIVIGVSNPNRIEIEERCNKSPNLHYYCQISNIAEIMSKADLAIGAAGTATWERCYLGIPSILLVLAENQVKVAENAHQAGFGISLGRSESITSNDVNNALMKFITEPDLLMKYSRAANDVMKGYVGVRGVVDKMFEL